MRARADAFVTGPHGRVGIVGSPTRKVWCELKALSRDDILAAAEAAAKDLSPDPLTVPELGGVIYIRGMSGAERDRFEEGLRIRKGDRAGQSNLLNFRAKMAVRCIVTEDGKRLLTNDDAEMLGQLPAGVLDRILTKINELSGRAKDEEDDLKNDSESLAVSGGSVSSSPASSNAAPSPNS